MDEKKRAQKEGKGRKGDRKASEEKRAESKARERMRMIKEREGKRR